MLSRFLILLTSTSLVMGCGSFNVNQFLESKSRQEAIDALLHDAQYEFDRRNYQAALKKVEKAKKFRPDGEHATVLAAYIHLGLAGLDILNLAKVLVSDDDDDDIQDQDLTALTFARLATAIGLGQFDLEQMGDPTPETPVVYLPKPTSEARESASSIMRNIGAAVQALCPFIPIEAKLIDPNTSLFDKRHQCELIELGTSEKRAQALFAWAIAHLGEAVSFYSLIFYQEPGEDSANLVLRAAELDDLKDDAPVYLSGLEDLAVLIETIFPTDPDIADGAMLNAMFDNLETTSRALGQIAGLPDGFSESISKALENVRTRIPNVESATAADNNQALKDSLTKRLGRRLNSQVSELEVADQIEACEALGRISSDAARDASC